MKIKGYSIWEILTWILIAVFCVWMVSFIIEKSRSRTGSPITTSRCLRGRSLRTAPAGNCHVRTYAGGVRRVAIGAELREKQVIALWRFGAPPHTESAWRFGALPTRRQAKLPTFNSRHFRHGYCRLSLWVNDEGGPRST